MSQNNLLNSIRAWESDLSAFLAKKEGVSVMDCQTSRGKNILTDGICSSIHPDLRVSSCLERHPARES
jgi:hypothetical protein